MLIPIPVGALRRAAQQAKMEEAARRQAAAEQGVKCPMCGDVDMPTARRRGSLALHVVLYMMWIVPGFLYGLWRDRALVFTCRRCGARMGELPSLDL
jgi:predicted RNA-binding Zn-ribbon protein involved in translation (DUF1610 family)